MADTIGDTIPWPKSTGDKGATAAETPKGGRESTPWIVVAENVSPGEAAVIKGRLESEEIPAVIQQEAIGSVFGLTVGPLGSANVLVPEPLAERALAILQVTYDPGEDYDGDDVDPESE
jgi:hypothetical protein